jgi:hypothetical protein
MRGLYHTIPGVLTAVQVTPLKPDQRHRGATGQLHFEGSLAPQCKVRLRQPLRPQRNNLIVADTWDNDFDDGVADRPL